MKKTLTALMVLVLTFALCIAPVSAEEIDGGWEIPVTEANALTEEAQSAFDKATEQLMGVNYTPVALLATQVVAGTNYCILCQATAVVPDAKPYWTLLYLYADLEGNVEILNIYDLYIGRHAFPAEE